MSRDQQWPWSCPFYDPDTMDGACIRRLIDRHTRPSSPTKRQPSPSERDALLDHIDISGGVLQYHSRNVSDFPIIERLRIDPGLSTGRSIKVFFVDHKRLYLHDDTRFKTTCAVDLHVGLWEQLLHDLEVHPAFVELLHDNNGGVMRHLTYSNCSNDANASRTALDEEEGQPMAVHYGIKIGNSVVGEFAAYARHDLLTGHDIVLVAGTNAYDYAQRLSAKTSTSRNFGLFHILLDLATSWLNEVEQTRWVMDEEVQRLESRTGICGLQFKGIAPLSPAELQFGQDLHSLGDNLTGVKFASVRLEAVLDFLTEQIPLFQSTCASTPTALSTRTSRTLLDTLAYRKSTILSQQSQISSLQSRTAAQIAITSTIIAQRDTQSGMEIAAAAKRDSELMRGIAVVTIIFLPATFMATFFSMTFFHVGDEERVSLMIGRQIWWYPAATVPLTVFIGIWYWGASVQWEGRGWLIGRLWSWLLGGRGKDSKEINRLEGASAASLSSGRVADVESLGSGTERKARQSPQRAEERRREFFER